MSQTLSFSAWMEACKEVAKQKDVLHDLELDKVQLIPMWTDLYAHSFTPEYAVRTMVECIATGGGA